MKIKTPHIVSIFDISLSVSEDARRQRLLDTIAGMMGTITLILLIWAVAAWQIRPIGTYEDLRALVTACIIMVVSTLVIFILNRFRSGYFARLLFVALLLLLTLFDSSNQIAGGRALLLFSIPIVAAAILIRPSASFILALISSVIVEIAAHSITPPLQPLPSIVVLFLLATFIWMATSSLERHIEKLRETNAALKESEERYRALVEISPDMITLNDMDGKIVFTNPAGLALFGYTDAVEVVGRKIWEFIAPEDRPRAIAGFGRLPERGTVAEVEYRALNKEGSPLFIELSASVLKDQTGQSQAVITVGRDITLRKKTEQALLTEMDKTKDAYRELVKNSVQGFFIQQGSRIILTNLAFANIVGLSPEEICALPEGKFFDFVHPDDRENAFKYSKNRLIGEPAPDHYETRLVHKNGTVRWVEVLPTNIILDGVPATQVITIDITERKNAEEAMQAARDQLEATLNTLPDILFELDRERRFVSFHAMQFETFFSSHEPFLGKTVGEAIPAEAAQIMSAALDDACLHGQHRGATFDIDMPDGKHWFELSISTIGDMNLSSGRFIMLIRDITSRNRAEEALRESEERYRGLAEAARDIIVIVTPDDKINYVNKFAAQMVGMTPEEIIGLPRSHFFPPAINDRHRANLQKVIEHGLPMFTESRTPFPSGEIWLSNWLVPLKDESGAIKEILGISRNITERKILEESLLEAKNSLEQRVIERTADLTSSREQLRELTRQTVLAQENERRRLSRELHDEAGQALIGLKFSLDEILAEIPESQENTIGKISKTMARVDDLNQQIRSLAHGLHPPILDVAGIDLALKGFCREFSEETHFPVTYSGTGDLPVLSEEISITLYRFTQEAITNVIKHAHASEAHVSLRRETSSLALSVKDNGTGFDTASTPKGIGLLGMEERLGLLGGKLVIKSGRKHGTHLKAVIPLTQKAPGL